jgi:hypothetical protein
MEKNVQMDAFKKQSKDKFDNKFGSEGNDEKEGMVGLAKSKKEMQGGQAGHRREPGSSGSKSDKPRLSSGLPLQDSARNIESSASRDLDSNSPRHSGETKEVRKRVQKKVEVEEIKKGTSKKKVDELGAEAADSSNQDDLETSQGHRSRPGSAQQGPRRSQMRRGSDMIQSPRAVEGKADEREGRATNGSERGMEEEEKSETPPPALLAPEEREGQSRNVRNEESRRPSSPPPPPPPDEAVESIVQFGVEASGLTKRGEDAVDVVLDFFVEGKHSGQTERLDAVNHTHMHGHTRTYTQAHMGTQTHTCTRGHKHTRAQVVDRTAAFRKTWKIRASSTKDRNLRFAVYRLSKDAAVVNKMWQMGESDLIGHVTTTLNTFIASAENAAGGEVNLPLMKAEGAGAVPKAHISLRLMKRKVQAPTAPAATPVDGNDHQRDEGEGGRGGGDRQKGRRGSEGRGGKVRSGERSDDDHRERKRDVRNDEGRGDERGGDHDRRGGEEVRGSHDDRRGEEGRRGGRNDNEKRREDVKKEDRRDEDRGSSREGGLRGRRNSNEDSRRDNRRGGGRREGEEKELVRNNSNGRLANSGEGSQGK